MSEGLEQFVLPRIRAMHGYVPGLQTQDAEVVKLNTNENPFPVSPMVRDALRSEIEADILQKYPNPTSAPLRQKIGAELAGGKGTNPGERILIGNGSDEILSILFRATLDPAQRIVIGKPTYSLYPVVCALIGARCESVDLKADWHMDLALMLDRARGAGPEGAARLVVITNPNAPTGLGESRQALLEFARANPGLTLVDEAYIMFGGESLARDAGTAEFPRLLVCGTFSKAYSLAGQRIGWLVAHPYLIGELDKVRDSYNLSRLAQAAGLAALEDRDEHRRRVAVVVENRTLLMRELRALGFECLESQANFLFAKPPARFAGDGLSAARGYYEHLNRNKIMIRYFPEGRTADWVRITIGSADQMRRLLEVTRAI